MNKNNIKSYAPKARADFIAAMTKRAALYGISENAIEPLEQKGDLALIGDRPFPAGIIRPRAALVKKVEQLGFAQAMEQAAFSWFNRLCAIRYMELKNFLDHGMRVLSHPTQKGSFQILDECLDLNVELSLPGLTKQRIAELKLDGTKDEVLYHELLLAQCHALHQAMPFLFEAVDDATELLLPDNLTKTDSLIRELIDAIPEEDWAEVEIIGWLYQFYISEKKDQVIGKVVKSEDIPAATQLFTPNWIVQYLVQNSVGRLWLMANPASTLASQWPYYIQPAEQTPEVQAQLDALIQTRMDEDGGSLNPETITVLDPACGSGHILVVAYDVLKAIYLERGYQARAIPRLILEKNLYGLDIDDRAAQMAGFALLMKARADDRRLFNEPPKLNVLSLQESKGLDAAALAQAINAAGTEHVDVAQLRWLIDTFEHAKTFGSLIQIDQQPMSNLRKLLSIVKQSMWTGDLYAQAAAQDVLPLVQQALVIGMQFDAVVANPPYMGGKGMNPVLKDYAKETFPDSKSDLFAMFMERGFDWCKPSGFNSMVTMQSWMFLSSFQGIREKLIDERTIQTMAHLGSRAFSEISGEVVQTTATIFSNSSMPNFKPTFFRLIGAPEQEKNRALLQGENSFVFNSQSDFKKIPGSPIAYWVSDEIKKSFSDNKNIGDFLTPKFGMSTGDSSYYRHWYEVQFNRIGFGFTEPRSFDSIKVWAPADKGGTSRRWYGNKLEVLFWKNDGEEIRGSLKSAVRSPQFFCKPHLGWTLISTSAFSARYFDYGFILDTASNCFYADKTDSSMLLLGLAALNSKPAAMLLEILNPTVNFSCGVVELLPIPEELLTSKSLLAETSEQAIFESKNDWDQYEVSWDFSCSPLTGKLKKLKLSDAWVELGDETHNRIARLKKLEEANNKIFIHAYGLQDELSPEVLESQITLARADREKDCQRLISYAIGCMMGRYSLDEPGLIYAYAGNVGFDASRYATFPADADGIVPLTDELWFTDDAANRVREFLLAVWGADTLEENMAWLAESLGTKASEAPDETIRRYLADKFFKDHLQTYKKRPIYWLFSSGKQKAFQCLVYLHRYNEGTLARMRTEYVIPLTAKLNTYANKLAQDIDNETNTSDKKRLEKELATLHKQQAELSTFDEKLRHHADQRISLDLDDGVKVNYGKFGDLLAEVKAVTGGGEA